MCYLFWLLVLIVYRQIPYAIGQFTVCLALFLLLNLTLIQVNELCHELAYRGMSEEQRRKLSWAANTTINLGSGLTAGVAAAILSQVCCYLLL